MKKPDFQRGPITLYQGDCLEILPTLEAGSVDAVVTDPPYPEIDRDYGRMTESEWHGMMDVVVPECRRILTKSGSAVYILQPNSEKVGRMRPWLWEFMAKWCREWNMVQDAWWWNWTALPVGGAITDGLLRASLKACVWLGQRTCYRDQLSVLWEESQSNITARATARACREVSPSGRSVNSHVARTAAVKRGGTTPFNVLPYRNAMTGETVHPASTPVRVTEWWVKYISPIDSTVFDPFMGSGTTGVACVRTGRNFIGIEKEPKYFDIAVKRIEKELDRMPLLEPV